jgi:heme exporter protein D
MSFESWSAFVEMGGHGPYVWTAYALGVLVLVLNVVAPWRAHRRLIDDMRGRERRAEAHRQGRRDAVESVNDARQVGS